MNRVWKFVRPTVLWIGAISLLVTGGLYATNPSDPEKWDATYESNPANTDNVSQGDDWMRQMKKENRRRLETEHHIGSGIGTPTDLGDNGAHRMGSARGFVASAEPTVLEDSAELHDNTSPGAGTGTLSAEETNSPATPNGLTVGHGRLWVQTPQYGVHAYDDVDAAAATNFAFKELYAARGHGPNYLFNGSFSAEGIQGLSPAAASCTDSFTDDGSGADCRNDPTVTEDTTAAANGYCDTGCARIGPPMGWTETSTPTDYTVGQVTDEATAVEEALGIGSYLLEVSGDSANDGLTQTLEGLREDTEYMVVAASLSDGTNSCTVDVTGESSTNLPLSSTASTVAAIVGWFITDSSATDVVLQLRNTTAATYDCHWTHVGVYAIRPNNERYAKNYVYEFVDTQSAAGPTLGPTREVIWGGNGCQHLLMTTAGTANNGDEVDLMVNVNGGGFVDLVAQFAADNNTANGWSSYIGVVNERTFAEAPGRDATESAAITIAPGDGVAYQLQDESGAGNAFLCDKSATALAECRIIVQQICE